MLDTLVIVVLAQVVFGVPLRGSLLLLMFLTLLFLLNTLGLGLLASTMVATQQQAMMFSTFVMMVPMIYLSGLIFPIENMPALFQIGSYGIPVRYYAIILRGVFLKGSGLDVLWPEALTLALTGLGVADLRIGAVQKAAGLAAPVLVHFRAFDAAWGDQKDRSGRSLPRFRWHRSRSPRLPIRSKAAS